MRKPHEINKIVAELRLIVLIRKPKEIIPQLREGEEVDPGVVLDGLLHRCRSQVGREVRVLSIVIDSGRRDEWGDSLLGL